MCDRGPGDIDPLHVKLLKAAGVANVETLDNLSIEEKAEFLSKHPEIAACYLVLHANATIASSHHMLVTKYLFKPQKAREEDGRGDNFLVSNYAGTTGLENHPLTVLMRGRKNALSPIFRGFSLRDMASFAGMPVPELTAEDLPTLVRPAAAA